jgi:hypothetical protein
MTPTTRSSSAVKRPGSGLAIVRTPIRSSPANIGTLSADRSGSAAAAAASSPACKSSTRKGARVASTRSLGRRQCGVLAAHIRRISSGAVMTRTS